MYFHSYVCVLLILCCVGYCLPDLMWFYLLGETFVTEFVLVPLFSAVLDLDSNSVFTASASSIQWLSLFPSGGSDRSTLICAPLAFVTALCGPLRGLDHLSDPFPTICIYFSTVVVCFKSIVG